MKPASNQKQGQPIARSDNRSGWTAARPAVPWWRPLWVWPMVTGLAVGFLTGHLSGERGNGASRGDGEVAAAPTPTDLNPGAPAAAPSAPPRPAGDTVRFDVPPSAPRHGAKNPKVTFVEVSDFQCPFCSRAVPIIKELEKKYTKDVAFVFVNQPLSFHQDAMPAAIAARAAANQGKFWEMHDKLFANQEGLKRDNFERFAKELGLNLGRFTKDLDDPKVREVVLADQRLATGAGASATPTFLINGHKIEGAKDAASFETIIDQEIQKANALVAKGTPLAEVSRKLTDQAMAAAGAPVEIPIGDAPTHGPAQAPVTIIEFSDFQCPFCSKVVPTVKQIEQEFKGKVRVAFKQMPLPFHNNAQAAAEAAMAAQEQGKFWEMHDKLFANQEALDRPSLERYAQELGLNMSKFKAALESGKFKARIAQDTALAATVGATGTPTLFVNGKKLAGARPFDEFKRIVEDELRKRGG